MQWITSDQMKKEEFHDVQCLCDCAVTGNWFCCHLCLFFCWRQANKASFPSLTLKLCRSCRLEMPKDELPNHNCIKHLRSVVQQQQTKISELEKTVTEHKHQLGEQVRIFAAWTHVLYRVLDLKGMNLCILHTGSVVTMSLHFLRAIFSALLGT